MCMHVGSAPILKISCTFFFAQYHIIGAIIHMYILIIIESFWPDHTIFVLQEKCAK